MSEPGTRRLLPWGTVVTVAALAAVVLAAYQDSIGADLQALWPVLAAAVAAFLVLRWQQNYLWGLAAGVLVALHPLVRDWVAHFDVDRHKDALIAAGLALIVLAGVVAAWRVLFAPYLAWRSWSVGALVFGAATGLLWPLQPRTGLVASAVVCGGLLGGALLATRRRRVSAPPSWWNVAAAALVGLGAPVGGLLLGPIVLQQAGWRPPAAPNAEVTAGDLWREAVSPHSEDYHVHGFRAADLDRWCWPGKWLTLALMAWGFLRTILRGWKLWARRRPPLAWLLTIYTVVVLAGVSFYPGTGRDTDFLSLAYLSVLLAVFGIADVARGFMERLVLAPPEDRLET